MTEEQTVAAPTADPGGLRETVRARYAEAARSSQSAAGCCGPNPVLLSETDLYRDNERDGV
ncbi:hypothetical protein INN71_09510, partial [Nocardioides sp. ChNu-153]|uniref:hypothetical protein n=1 Tax=unclassified Nocardioides TaxID=2615069 RepID=UPI0024058F40